MFVYFEPMVIKEVYNVKSKVLILFNGWGLKREKLSVISIIVHFINNKYKAVLRLIGLSKLLGHRKSGIDKLFFYYF